MKSIIIDIIAQIIAFVVIVFALIKVLLFLGIGAAIGFSTMIPQAFLYNYFHHIALVRVFCVEYPVILMGVKFLLSQYKDRLSKKMNEENKAVNWETFIDGLLLGLYISLMCVYVLEFLVIMKHTTRYSKILFCFSVYIIGRMITYILDGKKLKKAYYTVIAIMLILLPGGIVINESFARFHTRQYVTTVSTKRTYDGYRGSINYYVYFKGDKKVPLTKYRCVGREEYDKFIKGEDVIIETYDGILGLPEIDVRSE